MNDGSAVPSGRVYSDHRSPWRVTKRNPATSPVMRRLNEMPEDERAQAIVQTLSSIIPPPPPPRQVTVYYARFGDRVKIGMTTNLTERMKVIPHDEVLATETGLATLERDRHRQFADLRVTGEWFYYREPLVGHIASLNQPNRYARVCRCGELVEPYKLSDSMPRGRTFAEYEHCGYIFTWTCNDTTRRIP